MSNRKRKCLSCKAYKMQENGIVMPVGFFCKIQCLQDYAIKKGRDKIKKAQREKEKKDRQERKKRKEKLKDRRWYLKKAQQVFNKWIRYRDANDPCICCGKYHQMQYHAGHYLTTKSAPHLRFNEDNCHKQASHCNNYKSGNIAEYRINLIKKIGLERVEALENNNELKKWTIEELKDIIEKYKI